MKIDFTRRKLLKTAIYGTMAISVGCAVDAFAIEPDWVKIVRHDLHLAKLPRTFDKIKIVQISDLHLSETVSEEYISRCIEQVNTLQPQMVLLTGDYVTHDYEGVYAQRIIPLVGKLKAKYGVFGCLGNHDYGIVFRSQSPRSTLKDILHKGLQRQGVNVLVNDSCRVRVADADIELIGLGDLWAQDYYPDKAFRHVDDKLVKIVLLHNPDGVRREISDRAELILCGHTHGGQVRIPFWGAPILPIHNRKYDMGLFRVDNAWLYVNRGLGRLGRIRFNCRPEITVFTLHGIDTMPNG